MSTAQNRSRQFPHPVPPPLPRARTITPPIAVPKREQQKPWALPKLGTVLESLSNRSGLNRQTLIFIFCSFGAAIFFTAIFMLSNSPYEVSYSLEGTSHAGMRVDIKGPAAKLTVLLKDPQGDVEQEIIWQEQMMDNNTSVFLYMSHPLPGDYTLAVKTFSPERVVFKKKITFSLDDLRVENCGIGLKRVYLGGSKEPTGVEIGQVFVDVKKEGNLPVIFNRAEVYINGHNCTFLSGYLENGVVVGSTQKMRIKVLCPPEVKQEREESYYRPLVAVFKPGDKCSLKGKLFYEDGNKSMDFWREIPFGNNIFEVAKE